MLRFIWLFINVCRKSALYFGHENPLKPVRGTEQVERQN